MKLAPSADRVIILPDEQSEEKTAGGIIMPQSLWKEH